MTAYRFIITECFENNFPIRKITLENSIAKRSYLIYFGIKLLPWNIKAPGRINFFIFWLCTVCGGKFEKTCDCGDDYYCHICGGTGIKNCINCKEGYEKLALNVFKKDQKEFGKFLDVFNIEHMEINK